MKHKLIIASSCALLSLTNVAVADTPTIQLTNQVGALSRINPYVDIIEMQANTVIMPSDEVEGTMLSEKFPTANPFLRESIIDGTIYDAVFSDAWNQQKKTVCHYNDGQEHPPLKPLENGYTIKFTKFGDDRAECTITDGLPTYPNGFYVIVEGVQVDIDFYVTAKKHKMDPGGGILIGQTVSLDMTKTPFSYVNPIDANTRLVEFGYALENNGSYMDVTCQKDFSLNEIDGTHYIANLEGCMPQPSN